MCISVFYIKIMLCLKVYNMLAFLLSHWFYTVFCCYLSCVFGCSVSKQFFCERESDFLKMPMQRCCTEVLRVR